MALKQIQILLTGYDLYWETKKINNNMQEILKRMKAFLENTENVYGMHIEEIKVNDTLLVTTKLSSRQYPSMLRFMV